MNTQFDYLVFIGRFQPFHLAHLAVIEEAFKHSQQVIILLGSAQPERTLKNVFSVAERQQMILAALPPAQQQRIRFGALVDVYDDVKWTKAVKQAVAEIVPDSYKKIGLIGHFKDQSSYYLALFPDWPLVELDNFYYLSATPMREKYLAGELPDSTQVPQSTIRFLRDFQHSQHYQALQQLAKH
jgi:bifunctional NMN adenylyltransferase/nudix hydrolase